MKSKIILIATMLISGWASAVTVVTFSDGSGYAYGVLKNSGGSTHITCARAEGLAYDSYSAYTSSWCSARDSSGKTAYCYTSDPDFANAIKGLSDYGRLLFRWSKSGNCGAMQIVNSTNYLPSP